MGRICKFKWKTIIVKSKIIGKKNADGVSEKKKTRDDNADWIGEIEDVWSS